MHRSLYAAFLAVVLAASAATSVWAQTATTTPIPQNPKVRVDYLEPRNPGTADPKAYDAYKRFQAIHDRLLKREVLEEFSRFMAPLRLPVALRVKIQECQGQVNAFYDPSEWSIKLCYEFIDALEQKAPKGTETRGFTRQEAIVGGFVMVLLHETGHALSDIFELPVLGREEDSADQLAAFVMMQFGPEMARTAVKGAAYYWMTSWGGGDWYPHFDTHSTGQQRAANFLCIAYGGSPDQFDDLLKMRWLSKERAEGCKREYEQVRLAFRKTLLDHIDQDMMKRVQAVQWLQPDDGTW